MRENKKPADSGKTSYYAAFKAHDVRFDGRIFIGISSTGIYCRPVCRAKTPKEENCTFHASAAAAEAAGYRPCLRCRPELAPGAAPVDGRARLARQAALLIEKDSPAAASLTALSRHLGVSGRHIRRAFAREYGVSPVQYRQTCRLLLAKSLLSDSDLPVARVTFAAGFGSVRRFNALFRKNYRLTPSGLRKHLKSSSAPETNGLALFLGYRPPYQWDCLLAFLAQRAISGVETVSGGAYHRTAVLSYHDGRLYRGWVTVRQAPRKNALAVTVSESLLPVFAEVLARIRHLFDLSCDPAAISAGLAGMNEIASGMCRPGIRLPGSFDPFEMAVRAVLGQQITVKAAQTLAGRLTTAFGTPWNTPIEGLTHTFPTPADFCGLKGDIESRLGPLGITGLRARSIQALAAGLLSGGIELSPAADPEVQMTKLLALPGLGPWTVQYIAMRALGWPDAFPHTDYGVKKALEKYSPGERRALAESWRPWRSYATINLWNSLSENKETVCYE